MKESVEEFLKRGGTVYKAKMGEGIHDKVIPKRRWIDWRRNGPKKIRTKDYDTVPDCEPCEWAATLGKKT